MDDQVEIPRAFVCAESKIFDVSEWAICQESVDSDEAFNLVKMEETKVGNAELCQENKMIALLCVSSLVPPFALPVADEPAGVICKPNTHKPSFHVNMIGLDKSAQRSNSSHYPWGLDAEMLPEDDEFELWLQQALASGFFSGSPKVRKTWSPFKMPQKGMKSWRRSP
ncbi:hypothetical protein AXF42_Ash009610 [Apostasia shenzhenica]|uniref:Cleavage inducing molecular chaperone Jiv domain-containing protein n=1 Tax=Apostasia shenzhenica TaxID=1088818 RepID=A0A2I0B9A6_9ASPA|nr:hypothetical protein AXF42_Ash009610 [Apostasia shenzhenica]